MLLQALVQLYSGLDGEVTFLRKKGRCGAVTVGGEFFLAGELAYSGLVQL